jgi:hypothetical protein
MPTIAAFLGPMRHVGNLTEGGGLEHEMQLYKYAKLRVMG